MHECKYRKHEIPKIFCRWLFEGVQFCSCLCVSMCFANYFIMSLYHFCSFIILSCYSSAWYLVTYILRRFAFPLEFIFSYMWVDEQHTKYTQKGILENIFCCFPIKIYTQNCWLSRFAYIHITCVHTYKCMYNKSLYVIQKHCFSVNLHKQNLRT